MEPTITPNFSKLSSEVKADLAEGALYAARDRFELFARELSYFRPKPELDFSAFPHIRIKVPILDPEKLNAAKAEVVQSLEKFQKERSRGIEPDPLTRLAYKTLHQVFENIDAASQALFKEEVPNITRALQFFQRAQVLYTSIGLHETHYLGKMIESAIEGISSKSGEPIRLSVSRTE
jgi:hypothetical protein